MSQNQEFRTKYLWICLIVSICIGGLMILFLSIYKDKSTNNNYYWYNVFFSLGCGILIAGASLSAGGFLGFIFGIPSIIQNSTARLKYNDNLVQISDWLTKIIIGVGLTQLYVIPSKIKSLGEAFQVNFGNEPYGRNAAIAIISYFFLLGFFMLYFWTKTDYSIIMKDMDDEINKVLEEKLRIETLQKNVVEQEKKEIEQKLKTTQTESIMNLNDIETVLKTFRVETNQLKNKLGVGNNADMDNLDPQKDKWGGKSDFNDRKVTATVRESSFNKELFIISLEVSGTTKKPLQGNVVFHLHPTFPSDKEIIEAKNGIARLELVAWGAFTVGIECDNGNTQLEIDLAELPDAPQLFRNR